MSSAGNERRYEKLLAEAPHRSLRGLPRFLFFAMAAAGLVVFLKRCADAPTAPTPPTARTITKVVYRDGPTRTITTPATLTNEQIAHIIVEGSRATYRNSGAPCACRDDVTTAGLACGNASAEARVGGQRPFCKPADVPRELIEEARRRMDGAS
jgi:hypothetical protein